MQPEQPTNRSSRPTVGSTRDVSTGCGWMPPAIHRAGPAARVRNDMAQMDKSPTAVDG